MKSYPTLSEAVKEEWGLILFTILPPSAVGMILIGVLAGSPLGVRLPAAIVTALGLLASVGHLARPIRAPFSIRHWTQSWLSREILVAVTFFLLCLAWVVVGQINNAAALYIGIACLIVGAALIYVMGRAYQVWARPAWDGPEVFGEIGAVALVSGVPLGELALATIGGSQWLGWVGLVSILIGLALDFLAGQHRIERLKQQSTTRHNARESLEQCLRLSRYTQGVLYLDIAAAIGALLAVITGGAIVAWSLSFLFGLVSQLLSRIIFYALPVQRRYAVNFHSPAAPET